MRNGNAPSASNQPLSLLMVDVDNFKQYNDSHGHLKGDDVLRKVAGAVASEMRSNDLVARYGGEEFAVILPNQSLKGAAIVAERIRHRVERLQLPSEPAGAPCVTVSIGAATALPGPGTEPATADPYGRQRPVPRQASGPQSHQPAGMASC